MGAKALNCLSITWYILRSHFWGFILRHAFGVVRKGLTVHFNDQLVFSGTWAFWLDDRCRRSHRAWEWEEKRVLEAHIFARIYLIPSGWRPDWYEELHHALLLTKWYLCSSHPASMLFLTEWYVRLQSWGSWSESWQVITLTDRAEWGICMRRWGSQRGESKCPALQGEWQLLNGMKRDVCAFWGGWGGWGWYLSQMTGGMGVGVVGKR